MGIRIEGIILALVSWYFTFWLGFGLWLLDVDIGGLMVTTLFLRRVLTVTRRVRQIQSILRPKF
jgi:hypothetical protein